MKHTITLAAAAFTLALAAPAFAQDTAPGTSVQTGAAASNSMNSGKMSNSTMASGSMSDHSMKMKKKKHTAMMTTDTNAQMVNKSDKSNQPGTKAGGN
jgi:predicted regulator of Ras-like GTPase activity (Roadblock/LC7/MglB family)